MLQRAGGVPFFVVSYAQALSRGDIGHEADAVPWDVAQGVRQRVLALPDAARTLLSAAAVVGRECEPALLSAVAARTEEEVLTGLDAACRARLLIDLGHSYQFAHDVIREVVEADIGSARRAVLHRRVGEAIEALYTNVLSEYYETLADHYLRGDAWEQALKYLERSGDKATGAGAIREALNYYDQALAICARVGAPAQTTAGLWPRSAGSCVMTAEISPAPWRILHGCAQPPRRLATGDVRAWLWPMAAWPPITAMSSRLRKGPCRTRCE